LPFLQFCKKYDICNPSQAISGCAFGKVSALFMISFINLHFSLIENVGTKTSINDSTSRPQYTGL